MTLQPGQPLLHYRLAGKIGAGGMGEVWKAVDTTLDREVAIKVLPQRFTADAERLARFEREAKLLASLNHPNIAGVYGLHETEGLRFLAMELVEGEDLSVRLARGPVPLDDALDIARQVAEALEAAHECGIIHRDLKPANIQTTANGRVKVLDFGLAKALDPTVSTSGGGDPSFSPTLTSVGSAIGVVLGTAAYMSPEQARGKPVDRRADIWAFGVVLYEMLVGEQLFSGETVSDTLAAVLTREPDWNRLPSRTPTAIGRLLHRCLSRDPRMRLRDIGEARVLLESPAAVEESAAPSVPAQRRPGALFATLALAGIVAAAAAAWMLKPVPTVPVMRLSLASPVKDSGPREEAQISPDGRRTAYLAAGRLWIQDLDQLTARPVTGGDGAGKLAWSPDGSQLAFTVGPRLYHAPVGGDPELLATLPTQISSGGGLTWTAAGAMVYATGQNDLFEVPVTGGAPNSLVTPVLGQESDFHAPSALPEGMGIVYVVHRVPQGLDTLEVLVDGKRRVLFREEGGDFGQPVYSPTGHILFERNDTSRGIWALPFSVSRLEATGKPVLVTAEGSRPTVSRDGTLLYSNVTAGGGQQLVVADREGTVLETVGDPMQHIDNATLSPDETHVAACVVNGKDVNLWIFDLARKSRRMLVQNAHCASSRGLVSWSRTEPALIYGNTETGTVERRATDGTVGAAKVTDGIEPAWSPDGKYMVFTRETETTFGDLWWMRLDGTSAPEPLLATKARESAPVFSPDGTLLAYASEETGRSEIYVRDFPRGSATWQVSDAGGTHPRWAPSGDHLFYVEAGGILVDAEIRPLPNLQVTRLTRLFEAGRVGLNPEHGYDLFGNGDRILIVREEGASASAGDLTLVTGWQGP